MYGPWSTRHYGRSCHQRTEKPLPRYTKRPAKPSTAQGKRDKGPMKAIYVPYIDRRIPRDPFVSLRRTLPVVEKLEGPCRGVSESRRPVHLHQREVAGILHNTAQTITHERDSIPWIGLWTNGASCRSCRSIFKAACECAVKAYLPSATSTAMKAIVPCHIR